MLRGGGADVGVASAGIVEGTAIKPGAVTVMAEAGVDIGVGGFNQTSDPVTDFKPIDFDVVVSCCGCGPKLAQEWREHPGFEVTTGTQNTRDRGRGRSLRFWLVG